MPRRVCWQRVDNV